MHTFIDKDNREWRLAIDIPAAKRIREQLQVDLLKTDHLSLLADPIRMVDILFVLCEQQAKEMGVSEEQFGRGLSDLDLIEKASDAFSEELIDFFPRSRRDLARQTMSKLREMDEKVLAIGRQAIEGFDVDKMLKKTQDELLKSMLSTRGGLSTSSAESSDSTRKRRRA